VLPDALVLLSEPPELLPPPLPLDPLVVPIAASPPAGVLLDDNEPQPAATTTAAATIAEKSRAWRDDVMGEILRVGGRACSYYARQKHERQPRRPKSRCRGRRRNGDGDCDGDAPLRRRTIGP
jgi:hypothetical protein